MGQEKSHLIQHGGLLIITLTNILFCLEQKRGGENRDRRSESHVSTAHQYAEQTRFRKNTHFHAKVLPRQQQLISCVHVNKALFNFPFCATFTAN
jgi:hypothetical protein